MFKALFKSRTYLWLLSITIGVLALHFLAGCSNSSSNEDPGDLTSSELETLDSKGPGMEFFHGTFEDALALAAQEDKKVFVDVYTTWCGPCIVMQESVFPLPEVGDYFNARFVNFKFDAENEQENGPELAARYDIGVYPTYLVLDSEGREISRATSAMSGDQFISLASQMLGEATSEFEDMKQRFANGERSQEFIQQYLLDAMVAFSLKEYPSDDFEARTAHYEEANQYKSIAQEYFDSRPYADLINARDAQLVLYYKDKTARGDELVEFVLEKFEEFRSVSSDAAMSQFVLGATWYAAIDAAESGDASYANFIDQLKEEPLSAVVEYEQARDPESRLVPERMKATLETLYLQTIEDWDGLFNVYQQTFESPGDSVEARDYSSAARTLAKSENPEHKNVAVEYGKRAFEMDQSDIFVALDYFSVLVAVGRKEDALNVGETFRASLSNSEADKEKLETFNRITQIPSGGREIPGPSEG